jgi:tetratricopeptide (TPR) repeat protein
MMLDTGQIPLNGEALLWYRQGLAALTVEEYDRAIACYEKVLEIRSDLYEIWYERGLALENWGYYAQAVASFDRALSLCRTKQTTIEIWLDRGNALQYGLGEYWDAIACYDQMLTLDPQHELAWQNRGNAYLYGLSQPEMAITNYDRALSINAQNELAWRNRASALVELQRFTEAVASYDRALELKPDDEVAWHGRNLASERSGLVYPLPTTNRAWCGSGLCNSTFIEGETETKVTFSSDLTFIREIPLVPQGQPVLVVQDDRGSRKVLLEREQYTIGRDPKNDIQLHSKFASRHHAVLKKMTPANGKHCYEIVDGDLTGKPSTNGLMINGQKGRSRELNSEDVVVFGPQVQVTYQVSYDD